MPWPTMRLIRELPTRRGSFTTYQGSSDKHSPAEEPLQAERLLHLFAHGSQTLHIAAAHFRRRPSCETNIHKGRTHLVPRQIVVRTRDVHKLVFGAAESFHVQLHASAAKGANPFSRLAIFPVIADVVIHCHPRAVETINELHEPL